MEWESKTTSWNLSKLEMQDNSHQLVALAGTSGSGTENMFSVDLKLGGLGNTGEVSMDTLKQSRGLAMASSQGSGSAKRGRGAHNGGAQAVSCLVDGCTSDLSNCREYHRRHRVCERHSKTPVVLIGGAEQRFCQQCSRFHSLAEFDEVKRSCRKRLDGHNRRRRKTQPEAVFMPSGVIGRNHTGTGSGLIQFSSPYIHASSTTAGSVVWPTGSAQSQRPSYFPNSSCSYSSYNIGRGDNKQIQFMPSGLESRPLPAVNTSAICQQLLDQQHGGSSQKIAPNGFFQPLNLECALSLLSNNQMQSPVDGMMCVSHLERSNAAAASSPLLSQQRTGTCLHFSDLGQHSSLHGVEDENHPAASLIPTTKDGHGYDAIHSARHDGLSDNGPPRFFPFSWQ